MKSAGRQPITYFQLSHSIPRSNFFTIAADLRRTKASLVCRSTYFRSISTLTGQHTTHVDVEFHTRIQLIRYYFSNVHYFSFSSLKRDKITC